MPDPDAAPAIDADTRRTAAALATRYFAGTVTLEVLLGSLDDSEDPLIHELLVALTHEPRRGFLGVSEGRWRRSFQEPVAQLIAELEKGDDGRMPERGPVVHASVWSLVGFGAGAVYAGAVAIEQLFLYWSTPAPAWRQGLRAAAATFMLLVAVGNGLVFRDRLALYRAGRRNQRRR